MNGSTTISGMASSASTSGDNLSGKLIIKAQLGDDIRKIMIHNEDLTLNELLLMMERIYAGKISNSDEITIKYLDDDGDKITLLNDSDLTVALNFHKVLRLFVLVNGSEQLTTNETENISKEGSLIDAKTFRTELQQIRNSVQAILDRLQIPTSQEAVNNQEKEAPAATTTAPKPPTPVLPSGAGREFDPYKHLQTQRSSTPDSVRSKSSASNKTAIYEQKSYTAPSPTSTVDNQQHYQPPQSNEANKPPPTTFQQQQQMPTPHFVPSGYNDQQNRMPPPSFMAPPPSSSGLPGMPPLPNPGMPHLPNSGMPPMPNSGVPRFPTSFPNPTLPNANPSSGFTPGSAPPPPPTSANVQTSTFIGQQQQQSQPPLVPQHGGFYGQQQSSALPKSFIPNAGPPMNAPNSYPQSQPPPSPSNSAPATINPSFIQPTGMPAPPPLASQQPYMGYAPPPQNAFFNPGQPYSKPT